MRLLWIVTCSVLCFCGHFTDILCKTSSKEVTLDVTTTSEPATGTVCPVGYQLFESSCYSLVSDSFDWTNARTACEHDGGHLAFIQSQSEQTYLVQLAEGAGVPTDYWMGLTFTGDTDHPRWLDGTALGDFAAWDVYFDGGHTCVRLRRDRGYLWNDKSCSMTYGYICEIEVCPNGYQFFESSCYSLVSDTLLDWTNARTACEHGGGHLAFIQSQSEQTYLVQLAEGAGVAIDYWMGLTFTGDTDHPRWLDGTALGDFAAWETYFDEDSTCVRLRSDKGYLWDDKACHNTFGYICEIENVAVALTTPAPIRPAPTFETKAATFKASLANKAAPSGGQHHLLSTEGLSLLRCASYCLRNANCASFNYGSTNGWEELVGFCELYSMTFPDDELVEKRGYRHYR